MEIVGNAKKSATSQPICRGADRSTSRPSTYERALITKDIRKIHGTHKTPGYLVDYVVWQLAKWIEEIPADKLQFFEPGCGHAPFLVSIMRLLRTLDVDVPNLSQFFRERFVGVDNDPFALEIARLSLTLADEPNPDGWDGLTEADMYAVGFLEQAAAKSTVMLTNPPYESRKAEELLFRTLPHLPVGAVFGAVVPATLLFSDKKRSIQIRSWMIENCQLAEIDLFPDGLFTFGDHECALVVGRVLPNRMSPRSLQTRLRRVPYSDVGRKAFQLDYRFGTTRLFPQAGFSASAEQPLWIAEFQREIWVHLEDQKILSEVAEVTRGLQHKGRSRPVAAKTAESSPFRGSIEGFASSAGQWSVHDQPPLRHFNLAPEVILRPGAGVVPRPQVLVNHHPAGRSTWLLKPFIDSQGRPFKAVFYSVRPHDEGTLPLEVIWAILISPLSNLFLRSHSTKRDILVRDIRSLPIPLMSTIALERIVSQVRAYLELARNGEQDIFNPAGYSAHGLRSLLLALDAEVLRLYNLPAKAERLLLDEFRGEQRPGIPVSFTQYYSPDTPDVPLYAYLSKSYQQAVAGGTPELAQKDCERYHALYEKAHLGNLTRREMHRLHMLQAEIDGRDYAIRYANNATAAALEAPVPAEFEQRLRALSDRAVSATLKQGKQ